MARKSEEQTLEGLQTYYVQWDVRIDGERYKKGDSLELDVDSDVAKMLAKPGGVLSLKTPDDVEQDAALSQPIVAKLLAENEALKIQIADLQAQVTAKSGVLEKPVE